MSETPLLVRDVAEEALLARIFPLLPTAPTTLVGPGDDCAVVAAPDGRYVVSTDVLVEDRHFRRRWSSGFDVGRRAAVQNLADVVSMGARPAALVVSLVMPGDLPVDWVTGLARGLADACTPLGAAVVGGDLSGGDQVVVAVTVHGDLEGRDPVLRSGARPGDVVALAGTLGRSAAGLALLDAGRGEVDEGLVAAYLRPDPPLAAGPAAADAGATAMMDVSDGLLRDAGRIARASDVVVDIDPAALADDREGLRPTAASLGAGLRDGQGARVGATAVSPADDEADGEGVADLVDGWVLSGGEDHALLATFPADVVLPTAFRAIGTVRRAGGDGPGVRVDGRVAQRSAGWDHFRA
ncbi:thiamine-phosphate kinase [Cellulosimicrobium protaetiae]|uniref:Thiamine-monophosphate kinase n=1 Tax=Cellulosimicrobium protaetiae TaxID=2587808 RepID=A0A6M5UCR7_9MICO|nr:thiamine-phosphate kinase [Cellulosimicrobium protaetiae]QJW36337.1 thiamine-phosphate kinase [Cellulosimicrobium protaetiae]